MYGRVPCDDWLFSTWRLTDPDLLKQSFAEAVTVEYPAAAADFARLEDISTFRDYLVYPALILVAAAWVIKMLMSRYLRSSSEAYRKK